MGRPQGIAEGLAHLCPDKPDDSIYMSLEDVVVVGIEGGYEWFAVIRYDPDASGADDAPWAVVAEYPDNPQFKYDLTASKVRTGLERWIDHLLDQEVPLARIIDNLQDMDLNDSDCILQYATWGELRYG